MTVPVQVVVPRLKLAAPGPLRLKLGVASGEPPRLEMLMVLGALGKFTSMPPKDTDVTELPIFAGAAPVPFNETV